MTRSLSTNNIYSKKFKTFDFDGIWKIIFGSPERSGFWIIWGAEKHGKTWMALILSDYLSHFENVLYISGEEGISKEFIDACKRANIDQTNSRIKWQEYLSIDELEEKLSKRKCPRIIVLDNISVYSDELSKKKLREIQLKYDDKLFIFLAHEDRGEPYTAPARFAKKMAKIIMYVEGLRVVVSGRAPGGQFNIDEQKSKLYHGEITEV